MKTFHHHYFHILLFFTMLLLCSSCQTISVNGQFVDDKALQEIEDKKLSKAEVVDLIGSPTIIPDYNNNSWYYIQRTIATRAWFAPKVLEQRIVKITFGHDNLSIDVSTFNDMNIEEIIAITEHTKTHGTEASGLQKFVRNIGRFNKTNTKKKHK